MSSNSGGGRINGTSRYFGGQRYSKLKKECEKRGQLFVDTLFPPTNASLFLEEGRSSDIQWKRPGELAADPHLFVEGASANDVTQGILGNCWFVSACSALTHNQALLDKVIPSAEQQEWTSSRHYAGIFRFCFWRFGRWIDVVIDDLLPTRDGKLIFARSKTTNEFWSALLEKAFAKLYGCYENLVGGRLSDALQDVSGGVAESMNYAKYSATDALGAPLRLFEHLRSSFDHGALIVAAIAARTKEEIEMSLECGLVKGHAYAVTAVRFVDIMEKEATTTEKIAAGISSLFGSGDSGCDDHGRVRLIRLQNPWGEKEWNGPWSDGSKEWEQVTDSMKKELGITVDEDGEFWMPWDSFVHYFTDISVCQLFNTSWFTLSKRFREYIFFDEWTTNGAKSGAPKDMAGGCLNFTATCCSNPQYMFDVSSEKSQLMLSLTQKEINEGLKRREPHISIGMHLMRVERNRRYRVHQPMDAVATSEYANSRSVFLSVSDLKPGRYILMPTTFAPREQTSYMLRIYSDHDIKPIPLTKHAPKASLFSCELTPSVTRVRIGSGELNGGQEKDTYCVLSGGGEKCSTGVARATTRPEWNEQFLFHRRDRRQSYKLQLWEQRKTLPDKLIGSTSLHALIDNDCKVMELKLTPPGSAQKGSSSRKGSSASATTAAAAAVVHLTICAYDDPFYI